MEISSQKILIVRALEIYIRMLKLGLGRLTMVISTALPPNTILGTGTRTRRVRLSLMMHVDRQRRARQQVLEVSFGPGCCASFGCKHRLPSATRRS